ncbi:hypothetical protein [uncultured Rikenella sp.]|uniref:hypothetical protein n=1 Tax=uncultured Rikenella sp. TaxID=368003 RepID=UPI0025EC6885|nr:hypothetical protein [uncultured Rikenella sp.]
MPLGINGRTAPGYRERGNGGLTVVGNRGYSWSSAVNGHTGVSLSFDVLWIYLGYANTRGHALQLRCLSE